MDKKIKVLFKLNFICYVFMVMFSAIIINDMFVKLDIKAQFIIGIIPYILIACTSFILSSDRFEEFKVIKLDAIFDWVIRIIAFGIVINYSKYFENIFLPLIFISFAFIVNVLIEFKINKKLNNTNKINSEGNISITYEEKCNLRKMVNAVNSSTFLFLIFSALSLGVVVTKNVEGTTSRWYIPVVISILMCISFIGKMYNNYLMFYLDKEYAKELYIRDIIFVCIGYTICLVSGFIKMSYRGYSYVFIGGLLLTLPMVGSVRKMSLRVKKVKDSLEKEDFYRFMGMKN